VLASHLLLRGRAARLPDMEALSIALVDFDGTLAATHLAVAECLRRTLGECGAEVPRGSDVSAIIARGFPLAEAFRLLSPGLAPDQVEACVRRYRVLYPDIDMVRSVLYDGVQSSLRRLQAMGICIVVLSNKGRAAVEASLARFGLAESVGYVLADEPGEPVKPDPNVFYRRVAGIFGARPGSDYIMVGDTEADLRFARVVGIRSCWASYGYGDREGCRALAPDYEIASFPGLIEVVRLARGIGIGGVG
jgi:phosphoglycolate phosphatase